MKEKYTETFLKDKKFNGLSYFGKYCRDEISVAWADWKCVCGNIIRARVPDVVNGRKKSCSCFRYRTKSKNPNWSGCGELSGGYWSVVIAGAKQRNLPINITIKDAWNLFKKQKGKCALSGVDLVLPSLSKDAHKTASLDRIDSTKGYVKGNVQWIHKDINWMKNRFIQSEFVEWCRKIVKHCK